MTDTVLASTRLNIVVPGKFGAMLISRRPTGGLASMVTLKETCWPSVTVILFKPVIRGSSMK